MEPVLLVCPWALIVTAQLPAARLFGLVPADDGVSKSRQLDEVKSNVDSGSLSLYGLQQRRVAVFKRRIAQALLSERDLAGEQNKPSDQPESAHYANDHAFTKLRFRSVINAYLVDCGAHHNRGP
jgi:hypothetical protein